MFPGPAWVFPFFHKLFKVADARLSLSKRWRTNSRMIKLVLSKEIRRSFLSATMTLLGAINRKAMNRTEPWLQNIKHS